MATLYFTRALTLPQKTFFLFGARGTGKSTWLDSVLSNAYRIDLLRSSELIRHQSDPDLLRNSVMALPKNSWVIIDEVQRMPELLNEVHAIIHDTKGAYHFALTGSSARKLKRENANLLAGRAYTRKFYPLTYQEIADHPWSIEQGLQFGMLPSTLLAETDRDRSDYLYSYVDTYLQEEIRQEAVVRNLGAFSRFLKIVAIANAQILNISNVARDAGVSRSTVQGYFEVLTDTLIGFELPAFRSKAKIKEVAHPKFYLFDNGVVRTLAGLVESTVESAERGFLLETLFISQLRAVFEYAGVRAEMSYWRSEAGIEVDLICQVGRRRVGFEIKSTTQWKPQYHQGLRTLLDRGELDFAMGVYLGDRKLKFDEIDVLPFGEVLNDIMSHDLCRTAPVQAGRIGV